MVNTKLPKNFLLLVASQFLSKIGDFAHDIVFVLLVLKLAGDNYLLVGLTYSIKFIPYLFLGPLGGVIADTYRKKSIMLWSDACRFILASLLALIYILGMMNIGVLMIFGFIFTGFRTMFQPAYQSAVVSLLTQNQLVKGNSLSEVSKHIASIIGPLLCSILISFSGKGAALILDAVTFLLSLLFIAYLSLPHTKVVIKQKLTDLYRQSLIQIGRLKSQPELFITIVYSALCIFLTGALIRFILPAHILDITKNEAMVGYAMTILAIGSIFGATLFARINKKIVLKDLLWYWMLYGATFLAIAWNFNLYANLGLIFILGGVGVIVDIILVYNIQYYSHSEDIGKNFGIFSTFANTAEALSGLVSGVFAMLSIKMAFIGMAALLCVIPGYKYLNLNKKDY